MNGTWRTKLKEWLITFIHSAGKIKPVLKPNPTSEDLSHCVSLQGENLNGFGQSLE